MSTKLPPTTPGWVLRGSTSHVTRGVVRTLEELDAGVRSGMTTYWSTNDQRFYMQLAFRHPWVSCAELGLMVGRKGSPEMMVGPASCQRFSALLKLKLGEYEAISTLDAWVFAVLIHVNDLASTLRVDLHGQRTGHLRGTDPLRIEELDVADKWVEQRLNHVLERLAALYRSPSSAERGEAVGALLVLCVGSSDDLSGEDAAAALEVVLHILLVGTGVAP